MAKFESHITCHIKDAELVERVGKAWGWKFSKIDGDALLGAKPYCYLTGYEPKAEDLFARMQSTEASLKFHKIEVLRTKIERIIWDTKTGVDELTGA